MDDSHHRSASSSAIRLMPPTEFDPNSIRQSVEEVLLGEVIHTKLNSSNDIRSSSFKPRLSLSLLRCEKNSAMYTLKSLNQDLLITLHSTIKKYWDMIMEIVLVYNVLTTLFFIAYTGPGEVLSMIDILTWILFILNIMLNFFTQILDENGKKIRKLTLIAKEYLLTWFIFDVLAVLPFRLAGFQNVEFYLRMIRLFKLPKVFDITKGTGISYLLSFFNFGKRGKDGEIFYSLQTKIIASFVQIFIKVLFIVYFLGCFWFWIQRIENNHKYSQDVNKDEKNFAEIYGLEQMSSEDVALRCSYYMLTTIATIGYGDFEPQNIYEMSFIIFVMLFGISFFAVISSSFINAISYYADNKDELGELNCWLESLQRIHGKIPKTLYSEIIDHFSYYFSKDQVRGLAKNYWEAETVNDLVSVNQHFVRHLPEKAYYEILEYLFDNFLKRFRGYFTESRFKFDIIPHLQPRYFEEGKFVLSIGQRVDEIVFVLDGKVSAGIDVEGDYKALLFFNDSGSVVGMYNALMNTSSLFGYYAETDLDCMVVNAEIFLKILNTLYKSDRGKLMGVVVNTEINLKKLSVKYTDGVKVENLGPNEIFLRFAIKRRTDRRAEEGYSEEKVNKTFVKIQTVNFEMTNNLAGILKLLRKMEKNKPKRFLRKLKLD